MAISLSWKAIKVVRCKEFNLQNLHGFLKQIYMANKYMRKCWISASCKSTNKHVRRQKPHCRNKIHNNDPNKPFPMHTKPEQNSTISNPVKACIQIVIRNPHCNIYAPLCPCHSQYSLYIINWNLDAKVHSMEQVSPIDHRAILQEWRRKYMSPISPSTNSAKLFKGCPISIPRNMILVHIWTNTWIVCMDKFFFDRLSYILMTRRSKQLGHRAFLEMDVCQRSPLVVPASLAWNNFSPWLIHRTPTDLNRTQKSLITATQNSPRFFGLLTAIFIPLNVNPFWNWSSSSKSTSNTLALLTGFCSRFVTQNKPKSSPIRIADRLITACENLVMEERESAIRFSFG